MTHNFWKTQPVYLEKNNLLYNEKIKELPKQEDITPLPSKFTFETISLSNSSQCQALCDFLNVHQIKNKTKREFIRQYTVNYLQYKYSNNVHLLLIIKSGSIIVGCLMAHVSKMQINNKQLDTVIIDNIVVHSGLRNKKMFTSLIKESSRHFNNLGYDIAFGKNNTQIINNFAAVKHLNRAINVKKLKETGYISYKETDSYKQIKKTHKMVNPVSKNFRLYEKTDLNDVFNLYQKYIERYNFYEILTLDSFEYLVNNLNNVCYVMTNDNNKPIDFIMYEYYDLIQTAFLDEKFIWMKDINVKETNQIYKVFTEFVKNGNLDVNYSLDDFIQMIKNKNTKLYKQFVQYYCVYKSTLPVRKGVVKLYSGHQTSIYKMMNNLVSVLQNKQNEFYKVDVLELPEIMDSETMLYELLFSETAKEEYYTFYNYNIANLNVNQIAY